jgi:hypothetical protein
MGKFSICTIGEVSVVMMNMHKWLCAVLVGSLIVVGCGGATADDDSSATK